MKETAVLAATEAGKILFENFGKVRETRSKGDRDLVTNVDLLAEKKVLEVIKSAFPDHRIISEEAGDSKIDSDYTWHVDPLDGTHNYLYGIPYYGVSIGLYKKGNPHLGAIFLPHFNELYYAEKGKGAFLNGKPIHVSDRPASESIFNMDSQFPREPEWYISSLGRLVPKFFGFRVMGSAVTSLAFVAKGTIGAWLTFIAKTWDVAAGSLLVTEAGGKVTNLDGKPWAPGRFPLLATNGKIHGEVLSLLR
ncbi:MAG: inositol monophosphatase family protein [archaeon]